MVDSAACDEDEPGSDINMTKRMSIFDVFDIRDQLEALLGADVDAVVGSATIDADSRTRRNRQAVPLCTESLSTPIATVKRSM